MTDDQKLDSKYHNRTHSILNNYDPNVKPLVIYSDIDEMPDLENESQTHQDYDDCHREESDCRGHHKHHQTGDGFTQTTKWIEATTALFFYSYIYGLAADNCVGSENETGFFSPIDYVGISVPALIFGILLATLAAWGSAKSHQNLNAKNEDIPDQHEDTYVLPSSAQDIVQRKLSKKQIAALVGNMIAHTSEVVAPIILVIDNVAQKYDLSSGSIRLWQTGTIAFSMVGSWANVRTCKNSMLEQHAAAEKSKADIWIWVSLLAECIRLGLANADWIAKTITDCANSTKDVFEVSWIGFGVGIGVSALTVAASGYLHTLTNINYQTTLQPSKKRVQDTPLTIQQIAMQPFDYLAHIGVYSPRIDFLVEHVAKGFTSNQIPHVAKVSTHIASLAIGSLSAYADWRACKNNTKKFNYNNKSVLFQSPQQELTINRPSLTETLLPQTKQVTNHRHLPSM